MYTLKTLNNGLRLLTAPSKGTKTVTAMVAVATGTKYETKENNGISHFLEHMFFKGTKKRPNTLQLSSELDILGGVSNAFTAKEMTAYYIKANSEQLDKALELLSDMMINSKFAVEEIKREKGVIIEEVNMYQDTPRYLIEDVFENLLYGNQPAGWDTLGPKENIRNFSRKTFIDYYQRQYGSKNTVVCLAGNIDKQAEKLVNKYFSRQSRTNPNEKLAVRENQEEPRMKIVYKKTDQAHISLGVRTYGMGHKDEFCLKLLATILGGSMSSRIFINLRERNGLAYYVWTNQELYTDSGYITTQAGVPTDKIAQAEEIILEEYRKIKKSLVPEKEMKKFKEMLMSKLVIQMESTDSLANWYAKQAIMNEGIMTPESYLQKIKKITPVELRRVANEVFVNRSLNLAVVGPFKNSDNLRKTLTF